MTKPRLSPWLIFVLLPAFILIIAITVFSASALAPAAGSSSALPRWTLTASLLTPRSFHTATRLDDGRVLVTGGRDGSNDLLASVEIYDPAEHHWSPAADMAIVRASHTATLLQDGRVLVAGGIYSGINTPTDQVEIYDPQTGAWAPTAAMNVARESHTATRLPDGRVLVAGGDPGYSFDYTAEIYDPSSGIWTSAGNLLTLRYRHTATLLNDGRVLIAGGGYEFLTTEIYSPDSGEWQPSGDLAAYRYAHTANLLPDGRVMVAGGSSNLDDNALNSVEIFDPATGLWSPGSSLSQARRAHSATALADGLILVTGGVGRYYMDIVGASERYPTYASHLPVVFKLPPTLVPYPIYLPPGFYPVGKCMDFELWSDELIGTITECVPSVEVRGDGYMQFNFTWMLDQVNFEYTIRKRSDEGNTSMYITDNLGNRYDHVAVGGAAGEEEVMSDGELLEGWFLFIPAKADATTFTFHDDDNGKKIEGIMLAP